jgi:hypothetical protein
VICPKRRDGVTLLGDGGGAVLRSGDAVESVIARTGRF